MTNRSEDRLEVAQENQKVDGAAASDRIDSDWLGSIARPVLVVTMVSCIDIAVLAFLRQYAPDMAPSVRWGIVGMGVLAAIIGCATTTWLALPAQRLRRSPAYRLAEAALLVAAARAVIWLTQGDLPSPLAMASDPVGVFVDGAFLFAAITILFTWYAAIDFTDDLMRMALQPDELWLNRRANARFADSARPASTDRTMILRGFVARWVGWGILLILIASTLRMGVTRPNFWALGRLDVDPLVIGAILLYFLIGLLLISQGQLAVLRARWTIDRLPAAATVTRNWPLYTFFVILLFAVVAAFLPLGDTYLLSVVLSAILNAAFALVYLIFRVFTVLLLMLLSLLPFSNQSPEAPPQTALQAAAEQPPTMLTIPPWVAGSFFWISVAALLAYAAYFYFSDKEGSLLWLKRLWRHIVAQWQALFGAAHQWYVQRQPGMDEERASLAAALPAFVRRLLPWRLLSPNQRVRLLYFQLLEVAGQRSLARRPAETPDHFAPRLEDAIVASDEESGDIDLLTSAFVSVRYAGHDVDRETSDLLRKRWLRLRNVLVPKEAEKEAPKLP